MTTKFITPDDDFLKVLIKDLYTSWVQDPLKTSRTTLLFPTRRLCRVFQKQFLNYHQEATPIIMPFICAWTDIHQGPWGYACQPLSTLNLKTIYCRHIKELSKKLGLSLSFYERYARAEELLDFKEALDRAHSPWPLNDHTFWTEAHPSSQNWQTFIKGLEHLPSHAGFLRQCYDDLKHQWQQTPWPHAIYVMGLSPESYHDHALLSLILQQPQGHAYFWACPSLKETLPLTHPQKSLQKYEPKEVFCGPISSNNLKKFPHVSFIYDAFSPTGHLSPQSYPDTLRFFEARDLLLEAQVIAYSMKKTVVESKGTVALITPNRYLGHLVKLNARALGIEADDASGVPLLHTKSGSVATLLLKWLNTPNDPSSLLAFIKHPLTDLGGLFRPQVLEFIRAYEKHLRNSPSLIQQSFTHPFQELLRTAFNLWPSHGSWASFIQAHQKIITLLCAQALEEPSLHGWFEEAQEGGFEDLSSSDYQRLVTQGWQRIATRPAFGVHPRCFIWDMTQAQGQRPDHVILGGFNQGTWPSSPQVLMGLEDGQQQRLGLTSQGEKIGALAGRLVPLLLAPNVLITRSLREEGALTTPSVWWQRLRMVAKKRGVWEQLCTADPWEQWLHPEKPHIPSLPFARPYLHVPKTNNRTLSITALERLFQDPFIFCLTTPLKIKPLEPLMTGPDARIFGQLIHTFLHDFIKYGTWNISPYEKHLATHPMWPERAEKIMAWFEKKHALEAPLIQTSFLEVKGTLALGNWTLTAIADRIDVMRDGSLRIIDYKTGHLPKRKDVEEGHKVQLPLIGAMVRAGGFLNIPPGPSRSLQYWSLSGTHHGFDTLIFEKDLDTFMTHTLDRSLETLRLYETTSLTPQLPCLDIYDSIIRAPEWTAL